MELKDNNTQQIILEAAEKEFIDKGFYGAKTTEIAKRAGVNHAMLHYYFRTKENLFNMVFQEKIGIIAHSLNATFDNDISFFDQIKLIIETHFDFLSDNPKLLFFVYSEVIKNEDRRKILSESILPRVNNLLIKLREAINEETKKGTINTIDPVELLLNIISLNLMTFLALPLLNTIDNQMPISLQEILRKRKESNVNFVINALKV